MDVVKRIKFLALLAGVASVSFAEPSTDNIFGIEEIEISDVDAGESQLLPPDTEDDLTDFSEFGSYDENLPEGLYNSIWSDVAVNPYNINLYKMKDTVSIDMRDYHHPIYGRVTSVFGMRRYRYHYGTDIKLNIGDTVRSAFDGKVRIAKIGRGYGYYVLVRHDNGLETIYGHLSKILVEPETVVCAGDAIALGGNTGRSTGPHLHFEMRYVGNPINPQTLVDFETGRPIKDTYLVCAESFKYKGNINNLAYYTVRRGDTLSGIAKRRGTTVSKLCKLNNITARTTLKIGRKLRCS